MKTLNRCLNELDRIIIGDDVDRNLILGILNNVRKYVFNTHYDKIRISSKNKTTLTILQFINYMMQEIISGSITNQFIIHCTGLRLFIILIRRREIEMISDGNKLIEVKVI